MNSGSNSGLEEYFRGNRIFGDELDAEEIDAWYNDEKDAYVNLGAKDLSSYHYAYHALNIVLGYAFLEKQMYRHVLGIGSAYGHELEPIAGRIARISIVEPSRHFRVTDVKGTPVTCCSADAGGKLVLDDESVDLITCFGVLHHIPNVTEVTQEMHRCLQKGGELLVREPIVSMGDWRKPRSGLTSRERGLPLEVFTDILANAGFEVSRRSLFGFMPVVKLVRLVSDLPYNNRYFTRVDKTLAGWFSWNYRYHRVSIFSRFSPASCFWVARKC